MGGSDSRRETLANTALPQIHHLSYLYLGACGIVFMLDPKHAFGRGSLRSRLSALVYHSETCSSCRNGGTRRGVSSRHSGLSKL